MKKRNHCARKFLIAISRACFSICIVVGGIVAGSVDKSRAEDVPTSGTGVGPVKKLELAAVDALLAAKGKEVFASKCAACHKLAERYVGPALGGVTKRRTPEWVLNMILNPQEMIQKDPTAQALFEEFLVPMTFQNVTETDARAILEYLRSEEK